MSIHISSAFDSGNIEVLDASNPADVQLAIRPDHGSHHFQWFHFRVSGAKGVPLRLRLTNAHKASYPSAWPGYAAVCTTDRVHHGRVPTSYANGELVIEHTPDADLAWYSYFAPFSLEQHQALLARAQSHGARVDTLGQTLDGRDLDRLIVGHHGEGKPVLWIIARQHPGESMAEFWMEGFLRRLLESDDSAAVRVREDAVLHIVPNMNPDGSVRGHLRCNAGGVNLNRVWHGPVEATEPEVFHVLQAMDRTGVDLCLDVHGDEELPYTFISGAQGIPKWGPRMSDLDTRFQAAYVMANPSFQTEHGYPVAADGGADMSMCTNAVANRYDCLAMTLEMPFKDDANHPDAEVGWSPDRARHMGATAIEPILAVLHTLR